MVEVKTPTIQTVFFFFSTSAYYVFAVLRVHSTQYIVQNGFPHISRIMA